MALVSAENMSAQATGLGALPAVRQLGLLVGVALTIALGITVAMWSQTPNYSVLQADLSARALAEVTQSLDSAGIEYSMANGGRTLLVPVEKLNQARMKIASQGVSIDGDSGYALLDKEQGFGTSSFMQKAQYNRALEGELAKSISKLVVVESARVHLAVPKQSAFARKHSKPAVSVVLHVQPGRVLDDRQVAGIVNMVASSIPGLEAEHVTVIDQKGRLLTQSGSSDMMLSSSQFNYTRRFEEDYVKRIVEIVSPIVGIEGVRAQVVADIDFTSQEQTRESYLPEQMALRSEQVFEERSGKAEMAMGIPGALSNQPPSAGTIDENVIGAETRGAGNSGRSSSRAVRNYELDRTISHTRTSPTTLQRLSVAVVVDYVDGVDEEGNAKRVPLDAETIAHITSLIKESVGLDETRGDTINVANVPFQLPAEVKPLPAPPIWEQPWVMNLAKQVLGGLGVLFIAFGVLRPMLKNLSTHKPDTTSEAAASGEMMPQAQLEAQAAGGGEQQLALGDGQAQAGNALGGGNEAKGLSNEQQLIELASTIAKEDPKRVAQVMTSWVEEDE